MSVVRRPLELLDRALAAPRLPVARVLAWAATNYLLLLVCTALAAVLIAVPPLALLPSQEPLSPSGVVLLAVVFGTVGWVPHLGIAAAVSRTRRARLWMLLSSPLLGAVVLLLPYLLAVVDTSSRAVVLAWTLYGLLCRRLPRPAPQEAAAGRTRDDPAPAAP